MDEEKKEQIKEQATEIAGNLANYGKSTVNYAAFGIDADVDLWANYDFSNSKTSEMLAMSATSMNPTNGGFGSSTSAFLYLTAVLNYDSNKDADDMKHEWVQYGNNFLSSMSSIWTSNPITWDNSHFLGSLVGATINGGTNILQSALTVASSAAAGIGLGLSQLGNIIVNNGDDVMKKLEEKFSNRVENSIDVMKQFSDTLNSFSDSLGGDSQIMSVVSRGLSIFADALQPYQNGVDETSYGRLMESSWNKNGRNSFVSLATSSSGFVFADSTPLDPGQEMSSLYGNMVLGVPPVFTHITDPRNRTIVSEYLRDARYLTLYPGKPKYNGSNMLLTTNNNQYHQTTTPKAMIEYLRHNGFDQNLFEKDRRYYTFENDYEQYYSYLETMLNAIWVKMGLGTEGQRVSLYTFFDNPTSTSASLKARYAQGIGFLMNDAGVTESISSQQTSFGAGYASEVNSASETYQQINFLSGMGSGGSLRKANEMTAKGLGAVTNIKNFVMDIAQNTIAGFRSQGGIVRRIVSIANGVATDLRHFTTEVDPGATMQSFATTNGMKIVYPDLWQDSNFTHTYNFTFNFVSPYGDPLSIFQYVMVPFCTLLAFAMPRQAADNGYVSPFFVRADMPGLFTCDFGLISAFDWTRGGNDNLWTKDGLPRAISGTFTITDLYPYLAMTKRISFLSANPAYTSWLDSLAGLHVVNSTESDDVLNDYWKKMLNRVSGKGSIGLPNTYSTQSQVAHTQYKNETRKTVLGSKTKAGKAVSWSRDV